MVGDSVTHGGVTYEIPATGYIVALTEPLSGFVNRSLSEHQFDDLTAIDRGASHTGISTQNHPSYFRTATYTSLLNDRCRYVMIMPWLNDISPEIGPEEAAVRHIEGLAALVGAVLERSPNSRIFVLNYYHGATAPYALKTWAFGFTPENVIIYNREMNALCQSGALSHFTQVRCVNTNDAFDGLGISHVIGPTSRADLFASLINPPNNLQTAWLNNFYTANPDGLLLGDGVHLSEIGKKALADFLVRLITES